MEIERKIVKKIHRDFRSSYIIFIIKPYTHKIARSILKEPKIYFFDYGVVEDMGARFENFVALALYKHTVLKSDSSVRVYSLGFLKTKEFKEVDFVFYDDSNNVIEIIEAKVSDRKAASALEYFTQKYDVKSVQVVYNLDTERVSPKGVHIKNARKYLENLEE